MILNNLGISCELCVRIINYNSIHFFSWFFLNFNFFFLRKLFRYLLFLSFIFFSSSNFAWRSSNNVLALNFVSFIDKIGNGWVIATSIFISKYFILIWCNCIWWVSLHQFFCLIVFIIYVIFRSYFCNLYLFWLSLLLIS